MLWSGKRISRQEKTWGLVALGGAIVVVTLMMVFSDLIKSPYSIYFLSAPFFAVIIFGLARYRSLLSRLLSTRPLVLLGEASYSFYLLHFLILELFAPRLQTKGELGAYLFGVMVLGLVIMVSLSAYTYIETPLRRIIRQKLVDKPRSLQKLAFEANSSLHCDEEAKSEQIVNSV
jgi:peptidoglycan/LPS O-acetylase OafA/YrhL